MTLKEAILLLTEAGVDAPEHDARELFRHFCGFTPPFSGKEESERPDLISAVSRRAAREPLQYIIGEVGFYREVYRVGEGCLIPRPDTEILVDFAVRNLPNGAKFLDLCCGSGCVGISTLKNTTGTRCLSVDISDSALLITEENAALNGVSDRLSTVRCDLIHYCGELEDGPYSAILSNPPYVKDGVYPTLAPEIFREPKIAFVGGPDGGDFYRAITGIAKKLLSDGGFIAYEIGYDQAELICQIAKEEGFDIEIIKDYSGNDRVAVMRKPNTK